MTTMHLPKIAMRLAGAVLCFVSLAASAAAADLTGNWRVEWGQDPNNTNELELSQSGSSLTGNYINDSSENCSVTGTIDQAGTQLALQVACKKWGIRMEGTVSEDRKTVSGSYSAYLDDKGTFVMTRR